MVPTINNSQFTIAMQLISFYFVSTILDMSFNFSGIVESRDVIPQMLIMNVEAATYALRLRGEQGRCLAGRRKLSCCDCIRGSVMAS